MIKFGVVEAIEQVNGSGSAGGGTDPDPAGELGVTAGLERGHLLVPGLDESGLIVGLLPGGEQTIDAVAGVAEHVLDTPLAEPLQQVIGDCGTHEEPSWVIACSVSMIMVWG